MRQATAKLSGVLRPGEGPVREFAVGMMQELDRAQEDDNRDELEDRTIEILFSWVRGDLKPSVMRNLLKRYTVGGTAV